MIDAVSETGSTNADLLQRLREGDRIAEGYWLIADRQTAGKGRQGRAWSDGYGNFMGSTVVHRNEADPSAPSLALLAGIALHEAIAGFAPDPARLSLKWPNDVLLDRAKLAGILLEGQGSSVIVGIGVNLALAPELPDRETAALGEFGPKPDRDEFAARLAEIFRTELDRWRTYGIGPLIARWLKAGHPAGTQMSVHDGNSARVTGAFAGLADDGSLILRLADGSTRAIHAGDVILD